MHERFFFKLFVALFAMQCVFTSHALFAQERVVGVSLNTPQVWRLSGKHFEDGKERWGAPLSMELTRQAILIGARDELGLRTMDASLFEPTDVPGIKPLTLELEMISREGSIIGLLDGEARLLDYMLKTDWWVHPDQPKTVVRHELFSREEVVGALKKVGLTGEPNKWLAEAPVPEAIMELVNELSLVSQFRAARALHTLMRDAGESPERLWALSRVYANLGQECRWFIRCQYSVFQARSLLYAQRLIAKSPEHPLGRLGLAYAWTMASYTRNAGEQLKQFDQLGEAGKPWQAWADLLRACQMYDYTKLTEISNAGSAQSPVAALWGVVTCEFTSFKGMTFKSIDAAMDVNPLSTRNLYGGYDGMGVSAGHWLTEAAPKHFGVVTATQFARIDDAPEPIQAVLKGLDPKDLSLRDLASAGWALEDLATEGKDPGELGYGTLGTLIGEANALHILYRAKFMRRQWGVDTSEYLRATAPALSRHPFRPLILTFLMRPNTRNKTMADLMAAFEPGYVNPVVLSTFMWQTPSAYKYANGWDEGEWWRRAEDMTWMSGADWLVSFRWHDNAGKGKYAGNMGAYDPHHPQRIRLRLLYHDLKPERVAKLAAEYGQHPMVADALAIRLERDNKLLEAKQYAELAALIAPERRTIERVARIELLLGNEDRWLALMKSILKLQDQGLDHATINQRIAHTYMNQGRYEDALPYSKASADSWAGWAMNTYIINLAVLGRHNEAQAIGRRVNERYGMGNLAEQYVQMWAGTADQKQLSQSIERYYIKRYGNKRADIDWQMLYIEIGMGLYEQALERVEANIAEGQHNPRVLSFGVMVAQRLGRDELRDKLLTMLIDYPLVEGKRTRFALLGDLMRRGLEKGKIDWPAAEQWAKEHDEDGVEMPMALGLFALQMPNDRDRALAELLALAKLPKYDGPLTIIARAALRLEGYTDEQILPTGFAGHEYPQAGLD